MSENKVNNVRWYAVTVQAEHQPERQTRDGWSGGRQVPTFFLDANVQGITSAEHAERVARDVVSAGGLFEDRAMFHVLVQSAAVTPLRSTVDDAIDMVIAELAIGSKRDSKRDIDLIDLVRLAIHARMRDPGMSFEDVVTHYDATPGEVRGWWDNWS